MVTANQIGLFKDCKGNEIGKRVWMVCWNHTGTLLASCGENKAVSIWKYSKQRVEG